MSSESGVGLASLCEDNGDSGSWLKARFFDMPHDNVLAMTTNYMCNEFLSDDDRAMFEDMKRTDPERYKTAGLGQWGVAEGQFFKQWRADLHVVEPFTIPKNWLRFRSMDWGSARPYACHWWAVDYDGNLWCYRELYGWGGKPNVGTGETAKQVGEKIAALESREENVSYGVLDNACWASTGVTGPSIAEEMNLELNKKKLVTFGKSSKGRIEGANALKQRLVGNQLADGSYKPAIYFFSNCIHLIRTLPMLAHDKSKPETYDTNGEDHCFIKGTLINTLRGEIPIESVIENDYVLTRQGYKRVTACGLTKRAAKVITVHMSDGSTLTGTGNHPVFVKNKGFVPLDTLTYGDIIYSIKEVHQLCHENRAKQQTASCSMELHSDGIPMQNDCQIENTIGQTEGYVNREYPTFIERFGSSTMAKFQKAITFIIKMKILSIMTSQIWNCSKVKVIYQCTPKRILKERITKRVHCNILMRFVQRLLNGISPKMAGHGINNMLSKLPSLKRLKAKSSWFARYVEKNTWLHITKGIAPSFVLMPAMQNIGETVVSTTKLENVPFVEQSTALIDTVSKKLVAEKNVTYVVCLTTEKSAHDVYNLTVDEVHEYFANGFLVHNCVDSAVYACLSRPWTPAKPKPVREIDHWKTKTHKSAWTY